MAYLVMKYAVMALIVVLISEVAKRSMVLGAVLASVEARAMSGRNKDGGGPRRPERTHLARIPLDWEPERIDRTWQQTERARVQLLGGDDSAAKAKVTFAIPSDVWESRDADTVKAAPTTVME